MSMDTSRFWTRRSTRCWKTGTEEMV
jgi:hypothetical protein